MEDEQVIELQRVFEDPFALCTIQGHQILHKILGAVIGFHVSAATSCEPLTKHLRLDRPLMP